MLDTPLTVACTAATFLACGFAILVDSWRERMGGVVVLGGYLLKFLLGLVLFKQTILRFLLADMVCLTGLFYLCWKAPHPWPLWAFGVQFCCVMTELAGLGFGANLMEWTFLTVENALDYALLVVLLIGAITAMGRGMRQKSIKSHK